jgi:hypothetical protein
VAISYELGLTHRRITSITIKMSLIISFKSYFPTPVSISYIAFENESWRAKSDVPLGWHQHKGDYMHHDVSVNFLSYSLIDLFMFIFSSKEKLSFL